MSVLIEKYHGRVVDAPGDNILVTFKSVGLKNNLGKKSRSPS
jgi:hypothetical protein